MMGLTNHQPGNPNATSLTTVMLSACMARGQSSLAREPRLAHFGFCSLLFVYSRCFFSSALLGSFFAWWGVKVGVDLGRLGG